MAAVCFFARRLHFICHLPSCSGNSLTGHLGKWNAQEPQVLRLRLRLVSSHGARLFGAHGPGVHVYFRTSNSSKISCSFINTFIPLSFHLFLSPCQNAQTEQRLQQWRCLLRLASLLYLEHSLRLLSSERSFHTLGKSLCSLHTTSHEEKCCRPRLRRFDKPPVLIDFVLAKWTELIDPDYLVLILRYPT